jgi:ABC-type phosphate transport system permease subunit
MAFDISIAVTWILFLALFPMTFIWLRRAWRIFIKKDYSEVALKRGESPPDPKKWAPLTGMLNLIAGGVTLTAIIGVVAALFPYDTWSAMAGMTLWGKIIGDFIISRQAHPFAERKHKKQPQKS